VRQFVFISVFLLFCVINNIINKTHESCNTSIFVAFLYLFFLFFY